MPGRGKICPLMVLKITHFLAQSSLVWSLSFLPKKYLARPTGQLSVKLGYAKKLWWLSCAAAFYGILRLLPLSCYNGTILTYCLNFLTSNQFCVTNINSSIKSLKAKPKIYQSTLEVFKLKKWPHIVQICWFD